MNQLHGIILDNAKNALDKVWVYSIKIYYLTALTNMFGAINFTVAQDIARGQIGYNFSTSAMSFRTNTTDRLFILSSGLVGIVGSLTAASTTSTSISATTLTAGVIKTSAPTASSAGAWKLGVANSGVLSLDSNYITIEVDGTTYKLATVTES